VLSKHERGIISGIEDNPKNSEFVSARKLFHYNKTTESKIFLEISPADYGG